MIIAQAPVSFHIFNMTAYDIEKNNIIYTLINDIDKSEKELSYSYNISVRSVRRYKRILRNYKQHMEFINS